MRWTIDDRDQHGLLTPMALALDALENLECDCGEDEPGTCLYCRVMVAFRWIDRLNDQTEELFDRVYKDQVNQIDKLEKRVAAIRGTINTGGNNEDGV